MHAPARPVAALLFPLRPLLCLLLFCPLLTAGCSGDDPKKEDPDSDPIATGTITDDTGSATLPDCADGVPALPFSEVDATTVLGGAAADFTVPTTAGDWSLRANWTGCDTYLFIPDSPRQNTQTGSDFWGNERDAGALVDSLPPDTHVFFIPNGRTTDALDTLQSTMDAALSRFSSEDQNYWAARLHYVPATAMELGNWVGDALISPGWGIGIDRFQRVRYIGAFTDPSRYNSGTGWFNDNLKMAANEAVYYNFEAAREHRLAQQNATVLPVFTAQEIADPGWAGVRGYATVDFPDAATMADFDTMEFDLDMRCVGDGEFGTCPAWDYLVYMHLCDDADSTSCPTEIGRWITTYHREGRWVHDVSALLPLFQGGGPKNVSFYTTQPYEITLSVRLSNQGRDIPSHAEILLTGGYLSPEWEAQHPPVDVEIPAGVQRVELAVIASGHGMQSPGNCAEFCEIENHFLVNGTDNLLQFSEPGDDYGCMDQTAVGTVPNQYGTWWYGRNGWCPGKEVPIHTIDVTDLVQIGGTNTFQYLATFQGEPYPGGDARQETTAWLVYY